MNKFLKSLASLALCLSFVFCVPAVGAANITGDVNNDGAVTTADAILVLKFAAMQKTPTAAQKTAADLNGDGVISTADAVLTLKKAMVPTDGEAYIESLIDAGFPKSYTDSLLALHKKYPDWQFKPLITGINWSDAVKGERTPHKKQLIENSVQASYMCSCKTCKGVLQEGSNWYSASEEAVEYYLDPRNFLNENYIFQFESTAYDKTQLQEAVEVILKDTWMYNSYITYIDAGGIQKTYTQNGMSVKYSDAIMKAAKDSGMSAYYLASKIVQEVGSSSASNAGGSSGKCKPYNGIYNYYNIGAYTGAMDGLKWANGFMSASAATSLYKTASTSTKLCSIPKGTELYYMGASGDYYKVGTTVSGKSYTGYVPKNTVSMSTTYGRPWDNPYKTIYYGAKYINSGFGETQFTGYLQKFNVNPASSELYNHEYMANVRAAASEGYKTYKAYKECGLLNSAKVFSIPVFKNMPDGDLNENERFQANHPDAYVKSVSSGSVTLAWQSMNGAEKYEVYKKSGTSYKLLTTTASSSYSDTSAASTESVTYRVRAYKTVNGTKIYSKYCPDITTGTVPAVPSGLAVSSTSASAVTLKWNSVSCSGYAVYRKDSLSSSYALAGTTSSTTFTDKNLLSGVKYSYKIKAYRGSGSNAQYSAYSSVVSGTTAGTAVTKIGTVKVGDTLNVREKASTDAAVLCELKNGTKVYVISTSNNWHKITFTSNGKNYTGYVSADYITLSDISEKVECPYKEPTQTLGSGSSGEGVKWLQWYLWQLDYLKESDIDGSFGPTTLSALKSFQTDAGIDVDGWAGPGTREALKKALN